MIRAHLFGYSYVWNTSKIVFCLKLIEERLRAPKQDVKGQYSRLSLSRNKRNPQKHSEIFVFRHIRFVVFRKKQFEQPNFSNDYVIGLLKLEIYIKILLKRGEIAPQEQFLFFSTIFGNLILDFCVKTRTRFSLRDQQLFEIIEAEITRVDCLSINANS